MIRSGLLKVLAEEHAGLRMEEIERVTEVFFDEIAQRLTEGGRVDIRGFGSFSTRERASRRGRNPSTGEAIDVPAKRVPYFKPHKEIRVLLSAG